MYVAHVHWYLSPEIERKQEMMVNIDWNEKFILIESSDQKSMNHSNNQTERNSHEHYLLNILVFLIILSDHQARVQYSTSSNAVSLK